MAASLFTQEFAALEAAAERQHGLLLSDDLRDAMSALAELPEVDVKHIADMLARVSSPTGAGFLAAWLGAGVERGKDADLTCRPILDTFLKWSRTVETRPETDDAGGAGGGPDEPEPQPDPEPDAETIAGLQLLGQSLVAHLARSRHELRAVLQTEADHREFRRLEHLSYGAGWVMHLLRQRSGQLVVLNAGTRQGVIVRYDNISNCFHLFTLLQGALAPIMPDAGEPSEEVLGVARGRREGAVTDHAWWHYSQPGAATAEIGAMVWGEMEPDGIGGVDGAQVLLLWPPLLGSRSWDTGFFLPILDASPPNVEVLEVLSAEELDVWWARLGLPQP